MGCRATLAAQVSIAPDSNPQIALLDSDLQQAVLDGLSATLAAQVPVAPDIIVVLDFGSYLARDLLSVISTCIPFQMSAGATVQRAAVGSTFSLPQAVLDDHLLSFEHQTGLDHARGIHLDGTH